MAASSKCRISCGNNESRHKFVLLRNEKYLDALVVVEEVLVLRQMEGMEPIFYVQMHHLLFCWSCCWQTSRSLSRRVVDWKPERSQVRHTLTWTVYNQQVRGGQAALIWGAGQESDSLSPPLAYTKAPGISLIPNSFSFNLVFYFLFLCVSETIRSCNSWTTALTCSNFDLQQSLLSVS